MIRDILGPHGYDRCYQENWSRGIQLYRAETYCCRVACCLLVSQFEYTLKLIDRLRATRWTPPDYWQTDNSNGLVMVIRNYNWLNSTSRDLISTCSTPMVQTGEHKQTHTVWPWPTTLTQASQGQGRPPCQKSRSKVKRFKQESAQTKGRTYTHAHYQTYYLPINM